MDRKRSSIALWSPVVPSSFTNGDVADGAGRSLSSEQHDLIKQAFNAIDTDADGRIEVLELRAALDILGLEHKHEDARDMPGTLERIGGDSGQSIDGISYREFAKLAAEKLNRGSAQASQSSASGGGDSKPSDIPGDQMTAVHEAAHQRAQSITEYYMEVLQAEVCNQVKALVLRLQEDNANVLKQLCTSCSDPSEGTEAVRPLRPLPSRLPPAVTPVAKVPPPLPPSFMAVNELPMVTPVAEVPPPLPPSFMAVNELPSPPDMEPPQVLPGGVLPGGVTDLDSPAGSSLGVEPFRDSQKSVLPPLPRRRSLSSAGPSKSTSAGPRKSTASELAIAALEKKRGKHTIRLKATQALKAAGAVVVEEPEDVIPIDQTQDGERGDYCHNGLKKLQEEKEFEHALFVDVNKLKDQVRVALVQNKYNVTDYFKSSGLAQCIARSHAFEILTMVVVIANSVWIWVDSDLNNAAVLSQAPAIFQVMEHSFCMYFVFEWVIRFTAFSAARFALRDHWFVFDSALVLLMAVETWGLTLIFLLAAGGGATSLGMDPSILKLCRIMRLTRMARMARLLRYMPELLIILRGLWLASKSVMFTLILLLFTIFVFGIMFRQLTDGTPVGDRYFYSVHSSMVSLLLHGTLPDMAEMVLALGDQHLALGVLLVLFILMATLTIMNMLVGVLVESVSMVSTIENETLMVNMVRAKMLQMIEVLNLDQDNNGALSSEEFEELLIMPEAAQFIEEVGVDVVGLVEYSDFIFKDTDVSFSEFIELILQLRGTNQATVRDIVDLRKQVMQEMERNHRSAMEGLSEISETLDALVQQAQKQDVAHEFRQMATGVKA